MLPRLSRRGLLLVGAAVLLFIVIPAVIYHTLALRAKADLRAAIAETDADDPRWRYEQILEDQPPIPDDQNSALRVIQAWNLLPRLWDPKRPGPRGSTVRPGDAVAKAARNRQVDPAAMAWLRDELDKIRPAVLAARSFAERPQGRFPSEPDRWQERPGPSPDQASRGVAKVLHLDAYRRAEEGDCDGALESTRAVVNAGRALAGEVSVRTFLAQFATAQQATLVVERVLAQGQPSEQALAALQALLDDELRQPWLTRLFHFQRAEFHRTAERVERGEVRLPNTPFRELWRRPAAWLGPVLIARKHAEVLRSDRRVIELASGPFEQATQRLAAIKQQQFVGAHAASFLQLRSLQVADNLCIDLTHSHCAVVGIALERYRREHGSWPADLEALVPAYLHTLPLDPFDLKPLRYVKWNEGVVVYSVMKDGVDRVAASAKDAAGVRQNIGFRLWDVGRRRLPPRNPEVGPPAP